MVERRGAGSASNPRETIERRLGRDVGELGHFESATQRVESLANNFVTRTEINRAQMDRIAEAVRAASQQAHDRVLRRMVANGADRSEVEQAILYFRDEIKRALEGVNRSDLTFRDPPRADARASSIALHRYLEARLRLEATIDEEMAGRGNALEAQREYMALLNSDTVQLLNVLKRDVEGFAAAHHELESAPGKPTSSVPLSPAAIDELRKIPDVGDLGWLRETTLDDLLDRVSYYAGAGGLPKELPDEVRETLQRLASKLQIYDLGDAPLRDEIRRQILRILDADKKNRDPVFEGWKESMYAIRVDENTPLGVFLADIEQRIQRDPRDPNNAARATTTMGRDEWNQLSYAYRQIDAHRDSLSDITYGDSEYDEQLRQKKTDFIENTESEINFARRVIDNQLRRGGATEPLRTTTPGAGERPDSDGRQADWQEYYEKVRDINALVAEAELLVNVHTNSNQRSTDMRGTSSNIYDRYKGLMNALGNLEKSAPAWFSPEEMAEIKYRAQWMESRRVLADFDLVYNRSRSQSTDPKGLATERGAGFTVENFDFFIEVMRNGLPPTGNGTEMKNYLPGVEYGVGYRFADVVLWGLHLFELLKLEDEGPFTSAKWRDGDDSSKNAMKKKLKEEMDANFPDIDAKDKGEIEYLVYALSCLGQMQLHFFTDQYAWGASPDGNIADLIQEVNDCNPIAYDMYRAYKGRGYNPTAEVYEVPGLHEKVTVTDITNPLRKLFAKALRRPYTPRKLPIKPDDSWAVARKKRKDTSLGKAENIETSDTLTRKLLNTIAPLRERFPVETTAIPDINGRQNAANQMLANPYPTWYEFFVLRADVRRKENLWIQDWVEGKAQFVKFQEAVSAKILEKKDGQSDAEYRDALIDQLHNLINSSISGMKRNKLVSWNYVGIKTLGFIDRMFRAYCQADNNYYGVMRLHKRIIVELDKVSKSLESLREMELPGHSKEKMEIFLKRKLRRRSLGGINIMRQRVSINKASHPVGNRGLLNIIPIPLPRLIYELDRNKTENLSFHRSEKILGQTSDEQKAVPSEEKAAAK